MMGELYPSSRQFTLTEAFILLTQNAQDAPKCVNYTGSELRKLMSQ